MNKHNFFIEFKKATILCHQFTQQYVEEYLPEAMQFNLLNGFKKLPDVGIIKFLGGRLLKPAELFELDISKIVNFVWVNGKVPYWINLNVAYIENDHTYIEVAVSSYLTEYENTMYGKDKERNPFHILGPALPVGWKTIEESGKVHLQNRKR